MFEASKILWAAFEPGNLLFGVLLVGIALLWTRARRAGRALATLAALALLAVAIAPVGSLLIAPLEDRFPVPPLPERVDGIVVLGGGFNPRLTESRGAVALKDSAERYSEFIRLARRYPAARLVFTGGSGDLTRPDLAEAVVARRFFAEIGFDDPRVVYESRSRDTWENARLTFEVVGPRPGETWLLVTSARHMPRSVGVFRRAGWAVLPYPVDFLTRRGASLEPGFSLTNGLDALESASHEWVGLVAYRLAGRTDALFPAP